LNNTQEKFPFFFSGFSGILVRIPIGKNKTLDYVIKIFRAVFFLRKTHAVPFVPALGLVCPKVNFFSAAATPPSRM
jgi:hypothetical protein